MSVLSLLCVVVFVGGSNVTYAQTIHNSVQVEASGNGAQQSSIRVRTTMNGEVVESYEETSTDGSLEYTNTITKDAATVRTVIDASAESSASTETADIERLKAIIALLEELIFTLTSALSR